MDGSRYPWGWQGTDYSDESWVAAVGVGGARTELRGTNPFGVAGGWQLVARSLPPMEEKPVRFARVRRYRDDKTAADADPIEAVQALLP